jgi:hypothetical protein
MSVTSLSDGAKLDTDQDIFFNHFLKVARDGVLTMDVLIYIHARIRGHFFQQEFATRG